MKAKERGYLLIIVFSIAICLLLLFSMATGNPMPSNKAVLHQPPQSPQQSAGTPGTGPAEQLNQYSAENSVLVTEEYINGALGRFLPEGFPVTDLAVDIGADGRIKLSGSTGRQEIRDFCAAQSIDLGLKENVMLRLLPKRMSLSCVLLCSEGSDGGMLVISPEEISVNSKSVSLDLIPSGLFTSLNNSLNQLLIGSGVFFTDIAFVDGGIRLLP